MLNGSPSFQLESNVHEMKYGFLVRTAFRNHDNVTWLTMLLYPFACRLLSYCVWLEEISQTSQQTSFLMTFLTIYFLF